jgi:hypothetical protein
VTVPFELRWYMLSMPRPTYPVEARQRHIAAKESVTLYSVPKQAPLQMLRSCRAQVLSFSMMQR